MEWPPHLDVSQLGGTDALTGVFGQVNLYDADLRAVRLAVAAGGVPAVEVDLHLPAEFAAGVPATERAAEYRVTLRCADAADVAVANFGRQNVVGDYAFSAVTPAPADGPAVHVSLQGAVGCDLVLRCRTVSAAVVGLAVRASAA